MKITKLILSKYKLISFGEADKVVYTPNRILQLIIGVNGAGKSSLLKEFNPFPHNKNLYEDNGYKEIHIDDSKYILKYDNKCSFIKNGIELNTAKNKRVQLSLIKEHFNLTPYLQKNIDGSKDFTSLTATHRKELLTEISNTDVTFGLEVYNKLKSRLRDLKGGIAMLNSKQKELVIDEDLNNLIYIRDELKNKLEDKLRMIISIKPNNYRPISFYEDKIKYYTDKLSNMSIIKEERTLKTIDHELNTIKRNIRLFESMGFDKSLYIEYKSFLDNSEQLDVETILNDLKAITGLLAGITEQNILTFDKARYNELKIEYKNEFEISKELLTSIQIHTATKENDKVECPKCSNIFIGGHDEDALIRDKDTYEKTKVKLENLNVELTKCEQIISIIKLLNKNDIDIVKGLYNNIEEYKNYVDTYKIKYDYINKFGTIDLDTIEYVDSSQLHRINKIREEVKSNLINNDTYNNYKIELKKLEDEYVKTKEQAKILSMNDILNDYVKELKTKIIKLDVRITKASISINTSEEIKHDLEDYTERYDAVKEMMKRLSPTDGLIAQSLESDLSDFMELVNRIIREIWSYRLEVNPTNVEGDIDYDFSVFVKDNLVEDVCLLSTSQKEVVNLAIRIAIMERLNLNNYPFLMDEFATGFDLEHINTAYDILDKISNRYSNILIVTHLEMMYDKLSVKADISNISNNYLSLDCSDVLRITRR